MVLEKLTDEQMARFKEAFAVFDKNGDGTITCAELGEALKSAGWTVPDEEIKELIKQVDLDGNGSVSFDEFVKVVVQALQRLEAEVRAAFQAMDKDGSGSLSHDEVKQVFADFGEKLSDKDVDALIKEADKDGDGTVNYDEFVAMLLK
ncbi:calmodulin-like [Lytechinus pictus]|uniref:calmodulin-like n=1 Tax=Lytechinus pictus TaxID=7653 RepID=UPI00240E5539|nr:calmodulin-like [Lytechinus pictus]